MKKAHPTEDTSKIAEHLGKASTEATVLATTAITSIQKNAEASVKELETLADGVGQEPGCCWFLKLNSGNTWQYVKDVGSAHLLPMDASALKKKVAHMEEMHGKYAEIASKHKLAGGWEQMELALRKARTTLVCHTLVSAFTTSDDLKQLRKTTKDQSAQLKRVGVEV